MTAVYTHLFRLPDHSKTEKKWRQHTIHAMDGSSIYAVEVSAWPQPALRHDRIH